MGKHPVPSELSAEQCHTPPKIQSYPRFPPNVKLNHRVFKRHMAVSERALSSGPEFSAPTLAGGFRGVRHARADDRARHRYESSPSHIMAKFAMNGAESKDYEGGFHTAEDCRLGRWLNALEPTAAFEESSSRFDSDHPLQRRAKLLRRD